MTGMSYMDQIIGFLLPPLFFVVAVILFIMNAPKTAAKENFAQKHRKENLCIVSVVLVLFILFLYRYSNKEGYYSSLKLLYVFNIFSVIIVAIILYKELKKGSEDWYTKEYLEATLFYIEFSAICLFFVPLFLPMFKYIFITLLSIEISSKNLLFLLMLPMLILFMLLGWQIFYAQVKLKNRNIKTIDAIELKIVFLKKSLQSLTTVIALFGLTSWKIPITFQLLVFFIDAFVAYSYPLLDISKYVHEKEIEQNKKDEQCTSQTKC